MVGPAVDVEDGLRHRHILSISLSDEKVVQQLSEPPSVVHPVRLLPHWKAEKDVVREEKKKKNKKKKMMMMRMMMMMMKQPMNEKKKEEVEEEHEEEKDDDGEELRRGGEWGFRVGGCGVPCRAVCPDASVELAKDTQLAHRWHRRQEDVQVLIECVPHLVRAGHSVGVDADDHDEIGPSKRQA
ncbi:hypothetical protein SprV_0100286900 [Sparganum proliferum]